MNKNYISDLKSGFFVSLIALPLSLGIAIASSFPPIAGIITAIVGGLVASLFGGCKLSIKGPAAGLIVIVLASVMELGANDLVLGYRRTLAVCVFAAILQIFFSLFKFAQAGKIMPPSVIHGMLSAIGIIIVAKQIHILVGAIPHGKTTFELLSEIPQSIININPELAFIGIFTIICMIVLPIVPSRILKIIPPALMSLFIVIPLGLYWHLDKFHTYSFLNHNFNVGPGYLVDIPKTWSSFIIFPDFNALLHPACYKYILMLALVGSVESVLTVIAIDNVTKNKKKSDLDRDLLAVGFGNLICAFIGGLPMISEIVRSKANVDSGAKSVLSNFFHGFFLLLFISLFAPLIREIPLAALAAMLIITGLRLASISHIRHVYEIGFDQLVLFISTLIMTLAVDLLVGILFGMVMKLLIHYFRGVRFKDLFRIKFETERKENLSIIKIISPAIFTNYFFLQKKLAYELKKSNKVIVDFSSSVLVDHTTLCCLSSFIEEIGFSRIQINGLEDLHKISAHELCTRKLAKGV